MGHEMESKFNKQYFFYFCFDRIYDIARQGEIFLKRHALFLTVPLIKNEDKIGVFQGLKVFHCANSYFSKVLI